MGTEVRIAGPIDLRLLPSPHLTLNEIQIGSAPAPGRPSSPVSARSLGVEFALTVFGTDIVFSTRYRCELAQGWCPYSLDAARPQDLVAVDGSYQTYASGDGTRLVYRSQTDSGRYVPGFVRRWLAVESLSKQLEGIKARAEAASGG